MAEKRRVWDLPLRMFHWLLVLNIAASWYTAENGEEYLNVGDRAFAYIEIHFFLGYLALALVAFRIIWGFVGTRNARFASFPMRPKADLLAYLENDQVGLIAFAGPVHAGRSIKQQMDS